MTFQKNLPVSVLELFYCQGYLSDGGKNDGNFIFIRFIDHMKLFDPNKTIRDTAMFDGASNVHLGSKLMKIHYPELTFMRGIEHTVSLFFNDFTKHRL